MYLFFGQLPLITQDWIATQVASISIYGIKRAKDTGHKTRQKGRKKKVLNKIRLGARRHLQPSSLACPDSELILKSWILDGGRDHRKTSTYKGQHYTTHKNANMSPSGIKTHDPRVRVFRNHSRFRPRGHCVRLVSEKAGSHGTPRFYGTRRFIIVFTKIGIWSVHTKAKFTQQLSVQPPQCQILITSVE
jgi:hypothetical protein